jgi:hypothetical protein
MKAAGRNQDFIVLDTVNQSVFVVNSAAPPTLSIMFQKFRFAHAAVPVAVNVLDKQVDPLERFAVLRLPMEVVIKALVPEGKLLIHWP